MEYWTLTIAWRWHKRYGLSVTRIFKRWSGRSYWNGKLDMPEQSQRVGDKERQQSSAYTFLLRVIEEFADIVAGQDPSLD